MEARAYLRHARIAPRKVQIVLDLIRNKPVEEAAAILNLTPKAACEPLAKLLKSCVANAENNFNMDKNNLLSFHLYIILVYYNVKMFEVQKYDLYVHVL